MLLQTCMRNVSTCSPGDGMYGALLGALGALPRAVAAMLAAGHASNAAVVLQRGFADEVCSAAPDAVIHAAALAAKATLLAHSSSRMLRDEVDNAAQAKADVQAFVSGVAAEAARGAQLPRSRAAPAAAPAALAAVLGVAVPRGGARSACLAGPQGGLLQDAQPGDADVCKSVATALEKACLPADGPPARTAAWVLARCCRVCILLSSPPMTSG